MNNEEIKKRIKGDTSKAVKRLKREEYEELKIKAKNWYLQGLTFKEISKLLDVNVRTIKDSWAKQGDWEEHKKMLYMSPTQMKALLTRSVTTILKSGKPALSAMDATRFANAYKVFSKNETFVSYVLECTHEILNFMVQELKALKTEEEQEQYHELMKDVSELLERFNLATLKKYTQNEEI